MSTRYKGMVATGVWLSEKLLNLAKEQDSKFNLSHFVSHQLQKKVDSIEVQVDNVLSKLENPE